VLLWMILPSWGSRFLRPVLQPPNTPLRRSPWIPALQIWGVLTVLALLAYRLEKVPPPLAASSLRTTGWEALLMTSNLLLAIGLLVAGIGAWSFARSLRSRPLLEQPAESMFPLTRDDCLARNLQYLTYALALVALIARPIAGWIQPERVHDIWGNFFAGLVMTILLIVIAAGSTLRPANQIDRALGEGYRRMEVRVCYLLMVCLSLMQLAGLVLELCGFSSRRIAALLVTTFVCITMASIMLLAAKERTPPPAADPRYPNVRTNPSVRR
jgi:hypothetical protein